MKQKHLNKLHFHLWMPDLFKARGGIQIYSSFLLVALQKIYPNCQYNTFVKHDIHIEAGKYLPNLDFHLTGNLPLSLRTPAFAAQIMTLGLWQRPDLIISTHINFTVAAYWLKRLAGIPYWTVVHGIEAWDLQNYSLKIALQNSDCIVSVSNYTRDRLIQEQNLNPEKIIILPNTFDSKRFQIGPKPVYLLNRYNLTSEKQIILTVGRLSATEQYKGYDRIIAALPQIRQVIPDVHYLLVGKGDDSIRIKQLISELQLEDYVTLAGFVPDEELCDHYNLCDVFAMPSKGEGFGIVYLEALACGKPTLGGNKDAAIDALCQGNLGALVDPDNVKEIAKTLIQILQGTYPNTLMYQPEVLRERVINIYGFERFQKTLSTHLETQLIQSY